VAGAHPGRIIVGAILAILGIFKARPILLAIRGSLMLVESIPLIFGGEFLLTILPA